MSDSPRSSNNCWQKSVADVLRLWIATVIFVVATWLLVPNTGGKQIGARYLMHALPLLWMIAALQWQRAERSSNLWSRVFRLGVVSALLIGL